MNPLHYVPVMDALESELVRPNGWVTVSSRCGKLVHDITVVINPSSNPTILRGHATGGG
jgi:hypothetical protein